MMSRISELIGSPFMNNAHLDMVKIGELEIVNARYAAALSAAEAEPDYAQRASWGTDDWREFREQRNQPLVDLAEYLSSTAAYYRNWAVDPRHGGALRRTSAAECNALSLGYEQFARAVLAECR